MNKLIALSVLLLIGCSPASPDKSVITIGRPEKKANSYPVPIGIWLHAHNELPVSFRLDFTDRDYTGEALYARDSLFEHPQVLFYHIIVKDAPVSGNVNKGYWVTTKDMVSKENIYHLFSVDEKGSKYYKKFVLDRGDLLELKSGDRYKKVE